MSHIALAHKTHSLLKSLNSGALQPYSGSLLYRSRAHAQTHTHTHTHTCTKASMVGSSQPCSGSLLLDNNALIRRCRRANACCPWLMYDLDTSPHACSQLPASICSTCVSSHRKSKDRISAHMLACSCLHPIVLPAQAPISSMLSDYTPMTTAHHGHYNWCFSILHSLSVRSFNVELLTFSRINQATMRKKEVGEHCNISARGATHTCSSIEGGQHQPLQSRVPIPASNLAEPCSKTSTDSDSFASSTISKELPHLHCFNACSLT